MINSDKEIFTDFLIEVSQLREDGRSLKINLQSKTIELFQKNPDPRKGSWQKFYIMLKKIINKRVNNSISLYPDQVDIVKRYSRRCCQLLLPSYQSLRSDIDAAEARRSRRNS